MLQWSTNPLILDCFAACLKKAVEYHFTGYDSVIFGYNYHFHSDGRNHDYTEYYSIDKYYNETICRITANNLKYKHQAEGKKQYICLFYCISHVNKFT